MEIVKKIFSKLQKDSFENLLSGLSDKEKREFAQSCKQKFDELRDCSPTLHPEIYNRLFEKGRIKK